MAETTASSGWGGEPRRRPRPIRSLTGSPRRSSPRAALLLDSAVQPSSSGYTVLPALIVSFQTEREAIIEDGRMVNAVGCCRSVCSVAA